VETFHAKTVTTVGVAAYTEVGPYCGDIRYTIDTSIVVAAEQLQTAHDLDAIVLLIGLCRQGSVVLQLTEAYERDFARYRGDDARRERLAWLEQSPVVKRRASGAFRLDVSALDGNDLLADDELAKLELALASILPIKNGAPARVYSDIDHLIAHYMSGADAFITVDERTILRHREALAELGITVLTPAEAVARSKPL
jgi:hypothetical protein